MEKATMKDYVPLVVLLVAIVVVVVVVVRSYVTLVLSATAVASSDSASAVCPPGAVVGTDGRRCLDSPAATAASPWVAGGWYSHWDVLDQTIRKPRHPSPGYVMPPTQVYYPSTGAVRVGTSSSGANTYGALPSTEFGQSPMITSVRTPIQLGVWTRIGTAYTTNPGDSTVVYLLRKALDPNRDFYQYKIETDRGFEIPLDTNITELRNGQNFTIPGWDAKGPFTANITTDGYSFVYV